MHLAQSTSDNSNFLGISKKVRFAIHFKGSKRYKSVVAILKKQKKKLPVSNKA